MPASSVGPPELMAVLREAAVPVIEHLLRDGELERIALTMTSTDGHDEEEMVLELLMRGELATLRVWGRSERPLTMQEIRTRLGSDLQDFISESTFGWGELRDNPF